MGSNCFWGPCLFFLVAIVQLAASSLFTEAQKTAHDIIEAHPSNKALEKERFLFQEEIKKVLALGFVYPPLLGDEEGPFHGRESGADSGNNDPDTLSFSMPMFASEVTSKGKSDSQPYLYANMISKLCMEEECSNCPETYEPACGYHSESSSGHQDLNRGFMTFGNICAFHCTRKCLGNLAFLYCGECNGHGTATRAVSESSPPTKCPESPLDPDDLVLTLVNATKSEVYSNNTQDQAFKIKSCAKADGAGAAAALNGAVNDFHSGRNKRF